MAELEVWIVVDADGDYAVGTDEDTAVERFAEDVGGDRPTRRIKVALKVPLPAVLELVGEVSAEPEGAELRAV